VCVCVLAKHCSSAEVSVQSMGHTSS
jgi:hypothetical protein